MILLVIPLILAFGLGLWAGNRGLRNFRWPGLVALLAAPGFLIIPLNILLYSVGGMPIFWSVFSFVFIHAMVVLPWAAVVLAGAWLTEKSSEQ
ncbi:hypothetical protein [Sphingomicrobium flavum]|uniref:hypothetical protein n=1 Tax=Sphingomicrobium flavum TaxID=1229164 RepID=UPI0021AE0860|nr:hypothetical protein [Sphingomicrobium flavum]